MPTVEENLPLLQAPPHAVLPVPGPEYSPAAQSRHATLETMPVLLLNLPVRQLVQSLSDMRGAVEKEPYFPSLQSLQSD